MVWGGDVSTSQNGKFTDLTEYYKEPNSNGTNKLFGMQSEKLTDTGFHALFAGNKGGAFLSLEKWPEDKKMTSVTIEWNGDAVDPGHAELIKNERQ